MATVGGNVVVGGDVACALLALDATVDLGSHTVPLADFWRDPGAEIVRAVAFNDEAAAGSVYVRWARRAANSPAVVCVAVAGGRVAVGGVGEHPVRSAGAEAHIDDPEAAGRAAAAEVDPPADGIASAWYRKRMTEVFVRRALEAWHAV
jgi:CO/xanthine dehydrogenase FAD-binding subunit